VSRERLLPHQLQGNFLRHPASSKFPPALVTHVLFCEHDVRRVLLIAVSILASRRSLS
jgi:hypothetical protein